MTLSTCRCRCLLLQRLGKLALNAAASALKRPTFSIAPPRLIGEGRQKRDNVCSQRPTSILRTKMVLSASLRRN